MDTPSKSAPVTDSTATTTNIAPSAPAPTEPVPHAPSTGLHSPLAWGLGGFAVVGVTLLLLALAGVFHAKVPATTPRAASRSVPPGAELAEVRRITRPRYEVAVGAVKPVHEISLASRLLAKVVEVRVRAGQVVAAGELLVQLDDADLTARLKQAEAALQSATAQRDRTAADLKRAERLVESRAISRADFDGAVAAARGAASEVERITQQIAEFQVALRDARMTAPIGGTIVDKRVDAGDTVSPGQVVLTLYDPNRMQLVAPVRESLARRLAVGQQLPARLESLDHECSATISEIVPESDIASRSFLVKVVGPCPPGIYSGMFGRLQIPLDDESLLAVPAAAVRAVGQLSLVEVARDGQVERRSVQLGRRMDDDWEVLSGLRAGELVVVRKDSRIGDSP